VKRLGFSLKIGSTKSESSDNDSTSSNEACFALYAGERTISEGEVATRGDSIPILQPEKKDGSISYHNAYDLHIKFISYDNTNYIKEVDPIHPHI